jgi:hypothetical protein
MVADTDKQSSRGKRPKRGHGEGSIYRRTSDGRWVGTIMLGRLPDGRADRPKVTGATRGEVQRQLAALRKKADEGMRGDPAKERQTVRQYFEMWLGVVQPSVRPHTAYVYAQNVCQHILPTSGRVRLTALRPDAVQALYAAKLAEGLSAGSVQKMHVVLHRALNMAVKWGTWRGTSRTSSRSRPFQSTR